MSLKRVLPYFLCSLSSLFAQPSSWSVSLDTIPADLPLPKVRISKNPSEGYIFAAVPYWGTGASYLVIYNNQGRPVYFKRTPPTCADFKLHENGLLTYFDASAKKFFAMDSTFAVTDSFWIQNGFITDEHDIKFLKNGNALLIGYDYKFYDMSQIVPGGDRNASVVVDVVQEIDKKKKVVFEWKAYEHYKLTDVGPEVNLTDLSFLHSHINSIDLDLDSNLVVSARNLDEITKIDRKNGNILWRLGGKNNQFRFIGDTAGFNAQHSASILPNGNLILFDNGLYHSPHFSRAVEYKLDVAARTATLVWSCRNTPDIASIFWGNVQRLKNGNTFISWGKSDTAATEVDSKGQKVFEMSFPAGVFSYRVFRFPMNLSGIVSTAEDPSVPTQAHLDQNFPNPFNGSTLITYQLQLTSFVRLCVYDLLGREVARLVDEEQAPGSHRAFFAPRDLASGVFVYRLWAGSGSSAGKMLYLK